MGCVYWQYNDCWPCSSWSSVDYFGRWKALHYMARRFYAPLLVSGTVDAAAGAVDLYLTSDRMADGRGKLTWTVTDLSGGQLAGGALGVDLPARTSRRVHTLALEPLLRSRGASNLLVWLSLECGGTIVSENLVTFAYPRELKLADPRLSAVVSPRQGPLAVTLQAEHPALWAWLELEGVDARFSDNFVHVRPGQPVTITACPATPLGLEAFRKALRVRSLYDTYAH
jgi:beta-mannosidase